METLNTYKITWLVLRPTTGKATKKDLQLLNRVKYGFMKSSFKNEFSRHFPSLESAKETLENIKLSKNYEALFITDKQFGLSKYDESLFNVATKKQLENIVLI